MNSGEEMSGEYIDGPIPGTGQGWGRILLDKTLYFQGDSHNLFVADEHVGMTGIALYSW